MNEQTNSKRSHKRRKFSEEYKEAAIRLVTTGGGKSREQIAASLGIHPSLLSKWCRELWSIRGTTSGERSSLSGDTC